PSIDPAVRPMQSPTALARTREAASFASAQPGSETTLQLVRMGMSNAQPPDAPSRSGADATAVPIRLEDGSASTAVIAPAAPPAITPEAAPSALSIVHRMASHPLTLARTPDRGDAPGMPTSAVHDVASGRTTVEARPAVQASAEAAAESRRGAG